MATRCATAFTAVSLMDKLPHKSFHLAPPFSSQIPKRFLPILVTPCNPLHETRSLEYFLLYKKRKNASHHSAHRPAPDRALCERPQLRHQDAGGARELLRDPALPGGWRGQRVACVGDVRWFASRASARGLNAANASSTGFSGSATENASVDVLHRVIPEWRTAATPYKSRVARRRWEPRCCPRQVRSSAQGFEHWRGKNAVPLQGEPDRHPSSCSKCRFGCKLASASVESARRSLARKSVTGAVDEAVS